MEFAADNTALGHCGPRLDSRHQQNEFSVDNTASSCCGPRLNYRHQEMMEFAVDNTASSHLVPSDGCRVSINFHANSHTPQDDDEIKLELLQEETQKKFKVLQYFKA